MGKGKCDDLKSAVAPTLGVLYNSCNVPFNSSGKCLLKTVETCSPPHLETMMWAPHSSLLNSDSF